MVWAESLASHWMWLGLGLLMAIAEVAIPGVFLIWLAAAALITGIIAWLVPLGLLVEVLVFAALAVVAVFIGRSYLRNNPIKSADPLMNDRGGRAVGQTVVVAQVIAGGSGKVRLGDSEWLATGPDAEPGTRMKVTAHDGGILVVEHLH